MQQTTLPHRVLRSAKDLASATLSSAASELKDPRESKYAATSSSTQASDCLEHSHEGGSQSRPNLNFRGSSFRSETNDILRRDAEENFALFQQLEDIQTQFAACLSSLQDTAELRDGLCDPRNIALAGKDLEFDATAKAADATTIDLVQSTSRHELANESIEGKSMDSAHEAAVRRLNQIGAHMQRNLAMQTLQQDAHDQSHILLHHTRLVGRDELKRQAVDEYRNANHPNGAEPESLRVHKSATSLDRTSVARFESPAKPSLEKEENTLEHRFHCPYYECHHNLQLLTVSKSSSNQRPCVHVGCNLELEEFSCWAEHIHMPHHDLLGSH